MRPKICVSIQANNITKVIKTIKRLESQAPDLIEIRFDYSKNEVEPNKIRETTKIPLIATARTRVEGGLWEGNEKVRINVLTKASNSGFDYIDLEASTPNLLQTALDIQGAGSNLIISHHNLIKSPSFNEMEEIQKKSKIVGSSICKIVGTVNNYVDNLIYLEYLRKYPGNIAFGMGVLGISSRIISPYMGGKWTYASANQNEVVTPGQLTLERLRKIFDLME